MAIVTGRIDIEKTNWDEGYIMRSLARTDKFGYKRNLFCIPNVSHGFFTLHEADLLVCSKAKFLTEVEIKVTMEDWLSDKNKRKWSGNDIKPFKYDSRIKHFWYAAPYELATKWELVGIPGFAGVIGMKQRNGEAHAYYEVIRNAGVIEPNRALRDDEVIKALRLGALRYWDCSDTLWRNIEENRHEKEEKALPKCTECNHIEECHSEGGCFAEIDGPDGVEECLCARFFDPKEKSLK